MISVLDIDPISCTRRRGNLPRAIDRRLKIYGFMLLIEDTSAHTHGKGFGRYRSWGSIELRKVYANGTWRVSQSSGRRLTPRHNSRSEFSVTDFVLYLTDSHAREIIGELYQYLKFGTAIIVTIPMIHWYFFNLWNNNEKSHVDLVNKPCKRPVIITIITSFFYAFKNTPHNSGQFRSVFLSFFGK